MKAPFRVTNVARSFTTRMQRTGMHQRRRVILLGTKRILPSSRPDRGQAILTEEEMILYKERLAAHIDRFEVKVWDADGVEISSKQLLLFGEPLLGAEDTPVEEKVVEDYPASNETIEVSAGLYEEAKELLKGNSSDVKEALGESDDEDFLMACKLAEEASKKPRKGILVFLDERLESLD